MRLLGRYEIARKHRVELGHGGGLEHTRSESRGAVRLEPCPRLLNGHALKLGARHAPPGANHRLMEVLDALVRRDDEQRLLRLAKHAVGRIEKTGKALAC